MIAAKSDCNYALHCWNNWEMKGKSLSGQYANFKPEGYSGPVHCVDFFFVSELKMCVLSNLLLVMQIFYILLCKK